MLTKLILLLIAIAVLMAILGAIVLFFKDVSTSEARTHKCAKCKRHSLIKRKPEERRPGDSRWVCFRCGNDLDEFGRKL